MRKFLISLLLASAAASPAIAGPRDHSDRQQAREDRQQAREDRAEARDEARAERPAAQPSYTPPARAEQPRQQFVDRQQFARPDRPEPQVDMQALRAQREAYAAQRGDRRDAYAAQRDERIEQVQQRFEQRQQGRADARQLRQSTRPMPNVMRDRHPLIVSDTPRPGTQPPARSQSHVQWNTNWRNDHHYDWRRYRDHHRSRFHLGIYFDPFGWGYQPFSIGYRMWPAYYGNQYWIDPGLYGLPYPPPGAAWIRYFNDAMLIDTYSGTVIDVIPGFFW